MLAVPGGEFGEFGEFGSTALQSFYPADEGFLAGTRTTTVLDEGTTFDAYGDVDASDKVNGHYASPVGTPPEMRSLPPGVENEQITTWKVVKPLTVDAGKSAPWFGQIGGGPQYYFGGSALSDLQEAGYIEQIK